MKSNKNIREGYKKTAVGVIPEEWEVKRLGDIGETFNGLSGKTKKDFGEGYPYVTYLNIFNHKKIDNSTQFDYVKISKTEKQNQLKYGDLLFTTSSETPHEVGMSSVILFEPVEELYLNSFCFGLRLKKLNVFKLDFLSFLLRGSYFRKKMTVLAQGSTRFNLSKANFIKTKLPIPPLPEQQAIANCLTTWDKGIETLSTLIDAKREQKKGLMQQLLTGKKRLDGFTGEWEEVKLGSVSNIKSSKRVLQKDWISQGVPFYRTREIISLVNNKQFNTPIFISKELFSELSEKYGIPKVGDILVTGVGTIGETYIVKESDEFYFKDGNVLWIEISDKIDSHFLHYSFKTRYIRKQLMDNASITTVATFTISGAKDTNILLPSIEEQKAIVNILTTADQEISLLEAKLAAMKEEKKGLMQVLLTGEKRLMVNY